MTASSLLGLTVEQLVAVWPELIVHDDPVDIQEPDTQAYAAHPEGEFETVFNSGRVVDTVFVYRQSPLLEGIISFSASRNDVLNHFGKPSASSEDKVHKYLGAQGAWDRFDYPELSLHFQYVVGGGPLKLVTVMTREVAERVGKPAAR
jgi:hypothetical protein